MNCAVKTWLENSVKNKKRLRFCTVLICLVVTPVVVALIFSESMMIGIAGKFIKLSCGHLYAPYFSNEDLNPDIVTQLPSVYSCDFVVNGSVLLYSSTSTSGCQIKGIGSDYFNEKRTPEITFINDKDNSSSLNGISISLKTAEELGVSVGDKLAMMVVPDSSDSVLRPVMVKIKSLFYSGYDQLDSLIAFVDFDFAKTLFSDNSSYAYEIIVEDKYINSLDSVISEIGSNSLLKWDRMNSSVYRNFKASREAIFIVMLTIIVVAAFYSASVSQQLVQDESKQIAVMKLIGADRTLILNWAFKTVMFVIIKGIVLGLICGFAISYGLSPLLKILSESNLFLFSNYLLDFDIIIPVYRICLIVLIMVLISAVSVRLSLYRTNRIKPIQLFTE